MHKKLINLLLSHRYLSMKEQQKILELSIEQWMHGDTYNYQQVDDITVVESKVL